MCQCFAFKINAFKSFFCLLNFRSPEHPTGRFHFCICISFRFVFVVVLVIAQFRLHFFQFNEFYRSSTFLSVYHFVFHLPFFPQFAEMKGSTTFVYSINSFGSTQLPSVPKGIWICSLFYVKFRILFAPFVFRVAANVLDSQKLVNIICLLNWCFHRSVFAFSTLIFPKFQWNCYFILLSQFE